MSNNLAFSLQNEHRKAVIYITSDASLNKLTFTIANTGNTSLQLRGGKPVAETQRSDTSPSTLYLTFGSLLSPDEFKKLQWSAEGWEATYFTNGGVINWGLTPHQDMQIPAKGNLNFSLRNVTADRRPMSGFLSIDYYQIGDLPDSSHQTMILLQTPPVEGRSTLNIDHGFVGSNQITISPTGSDPVTNRLSFFLSNSSSTDPIVAIDTPGEDNPPVFILSFVEGVPPGFGALTSKQLASEIAVNINTQSATKWKAVSLTDSENSSWHLLPKSHEILGIGEASTVEIELDNIISLLEPGLTPLYLQWDYIPGYNSGFTSLLVEKIPKLQFTSLNTVPGFTAKENTPLNVELKWEIEHATSIELRSPQGDFMVSDKSSFELPKPVRSSMNLTLSAKGPKGLKYDENVEFKVLDFKVNLDPISDIDAGSKLQDAAYSTKWNMAYFVGAQGDFYVVDTHKNTILSKNNYPVSNLQGVYASVSIDDSFDRVYMYDNLHLQIYILNVDASGQSTLFRKLQLPTGSGLYRNIAPSPDGQTVYFMNGGNDSVGYFHLSDYVLRSGPAIEVASSLTQDLIVSPDGRYLYISTGYTVRPWNIEHQIIEDDINLNSQGWSSYLQVTPDGKRVYIANTAANTVTVIYTEEAFRVEHIQIPDTHSDIVCMKLSPDGSILYAIHANKRIITMIDVATNKVQYILTLQDEGERWVQLNGIAIAPNGKKLYVCADYDFKRSNVFSTAEVVIEQVGSMSLPE